MLQQPSDMKFCTNCRHLKAGIRYMCRAIDHIAHPVTGQAGGDVAAELMRLTLCGYEAKLWEARDEDAQADRI